ncbi:malate dehydrogenase, putative [Ricinus communis]|uniref:malate dehydrogenase n=1 Tax=Ricinus communis TaxID=3988 RepID=B9T5E3_RICCO|nr:malate dehydrogenase, putative [Ricinus communis]
MAKEPVRVLVTGAAGQIGYALVPMIARGMMLGPDQPVILHMLDIPPAVEALNGVKMELVDAAFPLLKGIVATTDVVDACTGVSIAVMVGGFPRKEGMERKDVMAKNLAIYKSQASALEKHAAANCKYPDVNHATVITPSGEKSVRELVNDDEWLRGEFITTVQQRGAAIIKARKLSSALSAASASCDHIRDWVLGTPEGTWVSMGVYSDGSYDIPAGLIYAFPVTCQNGEWKIVQGLHIDDFSRKKLDLTAEELSEEKALAYSCLS